LLADRHGAQRDRERVRLDARHDAAAEGVVVTGAEEHHERSHQRPKAARGDRLKTPNHDDVPWVSDALQRVT
jgi:hypothetical protein